MAVTEAPFGTYLAVDLVAAGDKTDSDANFASFLALFGDPTVTGATGTDPTQVTPSPAAHPDFDAIPPATRQLIIEEINALGALYTAP